MNVESELQDTSLKIVREFSTPIEKVYAAWTQPDHVVQWMAPGEINCKNVEIDLKIGGQYRIHMVGDDGEHIAIGAYQEIIPNKRLQFTWTWKDEEMPETLVTVDFEDQNGSTRLTLTHENFPVPEATQKHDQGWNGCLDKLQQYL